MKKHLFFLMIALFITNTFYELKASGSIHEAINDVTLSVIDDITYVRLDHDLSILAVGWEQWGPPNFESVEYTSYAMFDLTSIPDSYSVTNAQLHMYCEYDYNDSYSLGVDVYRITDDTWTENTINPMSPPAYEDSILSTQSINGIGWYIWDITSNWSPSTDLSDNYLSLILTFDSANDSVDFTSSEGGVNNLYLEIQAEPIPIPGAVWLLGSGLIGIAGVRKKFKK